MSDLIEKQVVIDAIEKAMCEDGFRSSTGLIHKTTAYEIIRHLPSAQPEIIRCRDCKYKGTKNCLANAWTTIFGVTVKDDFYCGLAERRAGE